MKISPEARTAIRRALSNAPGWRDYSRANNLSLASMGKDEFLSACAAMGLDARKIADDANANASSSNGYDKARTAARVFNEPVPGLAVGPAGAAFDNDAARIIRDAQAAAQHPSTQDVLDANRADHATTAARMAADAGNPVTLNPMWPRASDAAPVSDLPKPAPAPSSNGHDTDKAAQLMRLIAELSTASVDADQVRSIVTEEISKALASVVPTVTINLTRDGVTVGTVDGHKHPEFSALLRACTARDVSGYAVNCWIAGPAGSGKTHAAKTVAKALDVAFHFNGAIGMAHELLGFIDANGSYHRTPFREAYENGGVYLFDEVDGSDNAALLALNAALANNVATFPDGQVTRHENCVIIAAANTWGHGGTADYVGRAKIDAAFLSRFPARFDWQYDEALERAICGNEDFARRVQRARAAAKSTGLKVLITPRESIAGAALIAAGFTPDEAAQRTYLASLTPEQKRMIG